MDMHPAMIAPTLLLLGLTLAQTQAYPTTNGVRDILAGRLRIGDVRRGPQLGWVRTRFSTLGPGTDTFEVARCALDQSIR